jgi:hypothetical protein
MGSNIGTVPDRCQASQVQERTTAAVRVYVVMRMHTRQHGCRVGGVESVALEQFVSRLSDVLLTSSIPSAWECSRFVK